MSFNSNTNTDSAIEAGADQQFASADCADRVEIPDVGSVANKWNIAGVIGKPCPEWEEMLDTIVHVTPGTVFTDYPAKRNNTKDNEWLGCPITWRELIEGGKGKKSFFSTNSRPTWGLSRHDSSDSKEGSGYVFGNCNTYRRANAVTSICAIVLDVDSGHLSVDEACAALLQFGRAAILYTSFNHLTTTLMLPYDKVVDHAGCDGEPSLDEIKTYLVDKVGYAEPIIESASVIEMREATPDGWKIHLEVKPIPKFRIVLPLAGGDLQLLSVANKQTDAQKIVKDKIQGVSKALGIITDPSTVDVSRFFYAPRHKAGSDAEIIVIQGPPLVFDDIPASEGDSAIKVGDSSTPRAQPHKEAASLQRTPPKLSTGFDLLKWNRECGDAFMITRFAETLNWEIRTGGQAQGRAEILCPNDAAHSNAGDPNDRGCWIQDADGHETFKASCQHGHCDGLGKLEMLALMEEQVELPSQFSSFADALCHAEFYEGESAPNVDDYVDCGPSYQPKVDELQLAQNATEQSIRTACQQMIRKTKTRTTFSAKYNQLSMRQGSGDDAIWIPICDPFEVVGRTYSEKDDGQGLIIRFAADRTNKPVFEETISKSDLATNPRKVIAQLADRGLWISATNDAQNALAELLSHIRSETDVVTVTQPGWHGEVFVSPTGEYFGAGNAQYRLNETVRIKAKSMSGTLEGWNGAVEAALGCANADILGVGLCSGFTGCVVNLLNEPTSPILYFSGTTTRGKTTAQKFGASVWANPVKDGLLLKLNTTTNHLEVDAQAGSGSVLALDEGGQSDWNGAMLQKSVFNLAEGSGKRRLSSSATPRAIRNWSTCITLSEEVGFTDKVKRDGRDPAAGAVARCWEISFNDTVELDASTVSAIDKINTNFGHAGPAFVTYLIENGMHEDTEALAARVKLAEDELLQGMNAQPQHRRVAGAAALVQTGGELAQEAGLIPEWFDVQAAVSRVLRASLKNMATAINPRETAIQNLRENLLKRVGVDVLEVTHDAERVYRPVIAYYGFSADDSSFTADDKDGKGDPKDASQRIYCLPVSGLFELSGGNLPAIAVAKELKKQGFLIPQSKNNNQWPTIPGIGGIKHYRVSGEFFHTDDELEAADAADGESGGVLSIAAE